MWLKFRQQISIVYSPNRISGTYSKDWHDHTAPHLWMSRRTRKINCPYCFVTRIFLLEYDRKQPSNLSLDWLLQVWYFPGMRSITSTILSKERQHPRSTNLLNSLKFLLQLAHPFRCDSRMRSRISLVIDFISLQNLQFTVQLPWFL